MNRAQAIYIAKQLEPFLEQTSSTIRTGGIINELTKTQADPLDTITAAWNTVRKIRNGQYQTFSMIHTELAQLLASDINWYPNHRHQPKQTRSHQPINTRHEPECPTHPGQRANHCSGCRADQLAGHPGTQQPLI